MKKITGAQLTKESLVRTLFLFILVFCHVACSEKQKGVDQVDAVKEESYFGPPPEIPPRVYVPNGLVKSYIFPQYPQIELAARIHGSFHATAEIGKNPLRNWVPFLSSSARFYPPGGTSSVMNFPMSCKNYRTRSRLLKQPLLGKLSMNLWGILPGKPSNNVSRVLITNRLLPHRLPRCIQPG